MKTSLKWALILVAIYLMSGLGFAQAPKSAGTGTRPSATDDSIVATVGDEVIEMRELDEYSRSKDAKAFVRLTQQLYDFREHMLNELIGERLLGQEAQRHGYTVEELVRRKAKVLPIKESEVVEAFERGTKQRPPNALEPAIGLDVARPLIVPFLERQKSIEARARYVAEIREAAKKDRRGLSVRLEAPRQSVSIEPGDPTKGTGIVEIIEFADFECKFCKQLEPVLKNLETRFPGAIRLVWKDYPLPNHQFAKTAAEAARCAGAQGRFWEYRDTLFANQESLAFNPFLKHANALGLDADVFSQCLSTGKYGSEVAAALQSAVRYGVAATPTVFINGRMVTGVAPFETYERIVLQELERLAATSQRR